MILLSNIKNKLNFDNKICFDKNYLIQLILLIILIDNFAHTLNK
jgi:hypothetical protein